MKYCECEYENRLLAIIDTCNTTALLDIQFNGYADENYAIKNLFDDKFNIVLTPQNKSIIIRVLAKNINNGDYCHYRFIKDNCTIAEGFDQCVINKFNPDYFENTDALRENLAETEYRFSFEFSNFWE